MSVATSQGFVRPNSRGALREAIRLGKRVAATMPSGYAVGEAIGGASIPAGSVTQRRQTDIGRR